MIPVGIPHVGHRPHDGRAQRRFGHLLIEFGDLELRASAVGAEVAQQRLSESREQLRVEHRVARGKQVRLLLAIVVERDSVTAAAPLDVLLYAVIAGQGVGAENVSACCLTARECRLAAQPHGGNEIRVIGGIECREGEVVGLWVEPLDGEVKIPFQCALNGRVE